MSLKKTTRAYWKEEEEIIIQQWADKAKCYQWMHSKCHDIYYSKNAWYTIPVIIISTITGTANFAQDRFSDNVKQYVVMGIGTLSIMAGIITTIHQFLKIAELNEGHRVASISWCKFHNNLQTLVLRHPLDRMPPDDAINLYKEEYDRLLEISPNISKNILKLFNTTFKKNEDLSKPEICSKLNTTRTFKMTAAERQKMIDKLNRKKPKNPKMVDTFFQISGREPMDEEMMTGLENNILQDSMFNSSLGGDSNELEDNVDENENDNAVEENENTNLETTDDLMALPTLENDSFTIDTDNDDHSVGGSSPDNNLMMGVNDMDNDNFINTSSV